MKFAGTMVVLGWLIGGALLSARSANAAACRVETKFVAANVVAVPIAVAIGVPVAEVAPYYYSYQPYAAQPAPLAADDAAIEAIAARVVEKLRSPIGGSTAAASPASAPR